MHFPLSNSLNSYAGLTVLFLLYNEKTELSELNLLKFTEVIRGKSE